MFSWLIQWFLQRSPFMAKVVNYFCCRCQKTFQADVTENWPMIKGDKPFEWVFACRECNPRHEAERTPTCSK